MCIYKRAEKTSCQKEQSNIFTQSVVGKETSWRLSCLLWGLGVGLFSIQNRFPTWFGILNPTNRIKRCLWSCALINCQFLFVLKSTSLSVSNPQTPIVLLWLFLAEWGFSLREPPGVCHPICYDKLASLPAKKLHIDASSILSPLRRYRWYRVTGIKFPWT